MPTLSIGYILHGTLRPQDLAGAVLDALRAMQHDDKAMLRDLAAIAGHDDDDDDDDSPMEWADERINDGIDALQEYAPPFCYVGMHEGDGSDLGVWPSRDAVQEAIQDGTAIVLDDLADLDSLNVSDCKAEYAVHCNDHGNMSVMSVYRLKLVAESIWGCV